MKSTHWLAGLAMAVSCLALARTSSAAIVVDPTYTYTFTANPDFTSAFNGSTITIDDTGVIGFSFYNVDIQSDPFTSGIVFNNVITSYDSAGWVGDFSVGPGFPWVFEATGDSLDDYSLANALEQDPPGTWTAVSAPDETNTLLLTTGLLIGLAGWMRISHQRKPVLVRS